MTTQCTTTGPYSTFFWVNCISGSEAIWLARTAKKLYKLRSYILPTDKKLWLFRISFEGLKVIKNVNIRDMFYWSFEIKRKLL